MHAANQYPQPSTTNRHGRGRAFFLLALLSLALARASAQTGVQTPLSVPSAAKPASSGSATRTAKTAPATSSKPTWQDLTPVQQISLKPLAANWNSLGESQKRKWLAVAVNYPAMTEREQERLHSRMTEWVSLSQQQRAQARLNFARSKQLTPSEKAATWKAYQELSPEEKQKLAASATPKPAGAAAAAKPVPPQKLAVVPATRQTAKTPRIAASTPALNHTSLLPKTQPELGSAPTTKN